MEKMSRIEIEKNILEQIQEWYSDLSREDLTNLFYSFLTFDEETVDEITKRVCTKYRMHEEQLVAMKKDMIIECILDAYEYFFRLKADGKLSEELKNIMDELEKVTFSLDNFYNYFLDSVNQEKVKNLIFHCLLFRMQDSKFIEACDDFLRMNAPELWMKLSKYMQYIEASDLLCTIFCDIFEEEDEEDSDEEVEDFDNDLDEFEEYDEEDEDEYDEEDFDEALEEELVEMEPLEKVMDDSFSQDCQTLFQRVNDFIEDYFDDKFDADDFIGYFMSLVYALLLQEEKTDTLFLEEKELLEILEKNRCSQEQIVILFTTSKEFVYHSLDLFEECYYDFEGDVFSVREFIQDIGAYNRFSIMDPLYEKPKIDIQSIQCKNFTTSFFDQLLHRLKQEYPEDYEDKIYKLLTEEGYLSSVFPESTMEEVPFSLYQISFIRYLSRRYFENTCDKAIGNLSLEQIYLYQHLLSSKGTQKELLRNFYVGYKDYLDAYFELTSQETPFIRKKIRKLEHQQLLPTVVRIDPSCIGDNDYIKTLLESPFSRYLAIHGSLKTISYLKKCYRDQPKQCLEFLREIIVSTCSQEMDAKDTVSSSILPLLEDEHLSLEDCLTSILANESLLQELLEKYTKFELEETPLTVSKESLNFSPKIKRKLYPESKSGNE